MEEFAVMKQVDDEEPTVHLDGFSSQDKATSAMYKAEDYLSSILHDGLVVRSAQEAARAAEQLQYARSTRYYVAKRTITPWEEADL